jgi:hypothetical protein
MTSVSARPLAEVIRNVARLEPLERSGEWDNDEVPETFPSAL